MKIQEYKYKLHLWIRIENVNTSKESGYKRQSEATSACVQGKNKSHEC